MNFLDGSLFPKPRKLVITAAPYGPEWVPSDFQRHDPSRWKRRSEGGGLLQRGRHRKLHLHVRELDGKGSSACPSSTS